MRGKYIIGIDLGGTNLKIALLDSRYKIVHRQVLSTQAYVTKALLINAIGDAIRNLLITYRVRKNKIIGVGLGLPGPVDTTRGIVHFFPNIPGWKDVALKSILAKLIQLPVYLDNDANLMCLAEYTLGAARGSRNAVCLTLGTGVGGGIIIDGKLYRGSNFVAGEIGHVPLNEQGPVCNCGGVACLERYVGNRRILEQSRKTFGKDITLEQVSILARRGNQKAKKIWQGVGTHLGIAIATAINILNPDYVVIGGGVANAGKVLFDQIKKVVRARAMSVPGSNVTICKSQLGNDAGVIGAAILVKDNLLSSSSSRIR